MKRKTKTTRSKKLDLRLTPEEYDKLQQKFRTTTYRKLSEYVRDLVQEKPVTVYYRNQSLDEFLAFAITLKKELNACGKNVNEAVKKLQSLRDTGALHSNLEYYEAEQFALIQKVEEIRITLIKIYQSWLQK